MSYTVISTNIRFDNPSDGEHDWNGRRDILTSLLKEHAPDLIGTQEGREAQLRDFTEQFPCLKLIESHREWIKQRMYPCILVNPKKINVIDSGDIWLSETPYIAGSKSFESAFPRLCTWIKAKFIKEDKSFLYINTHLDHVLSSTRHEQIKVLLSEIKKINTEALPIILTGDFNEDPSENVHRELLDSALDLYDPWKSLGLNEEHSFHKFDGKNQRVDRIDWIILNKDFKCEQIKLEKRSKDGIYPSDHFPVISNFSFD